MHSGRRIAARRPTRHAISANGANSAERKLRLWPVFALFPIIVAASVKATGLVAIGGADITVLSVAFVLAAALVTFLRHPRYPVVDMLPFFLFALVVLVGVVRSDQGEYQSLKTRDFFLLTSVVVVCIPVLVRDLRDIRGLVAVWFAGGTFTAALVLLVGAGEELYGRAGIGEATLGPAYMSAAALVAGSAALGERMLPPPLLLPGMAVCGIALVAIGSRGPMVAAVVGIAAWLALRGVLRARSLLVLLAVSVVIVLGVSQASEAALSRFVLSDPARQDLSATARMSFLESPLLGLGWGDFSTVAWAVYPHNMFMETAAELGFVGLLSITALLVVAFVRVWRSRSVPEARAIFAVAVVMLIGQQFSDDLTNRVFWIAIVPCLLSAMSGGTAPVPAATGRGHRRVRRATPPTHGSGQPQVGPQPIGTRATRAGTPQPS